MSAPQKTVGIEVQNSVEVRSAIAVAQSIQAILKAGRSDQVTIEAIRCLGSALTSRASLVNNTISMG